MARTGSGRLASSSLQVIASKALDMEGRELHRVGELMLPPYSRTTTSELPSVPRYEGRFNGDGGYAGARWGRAGWPQWQVAVYCQSGGGVIISAGAPPGSGRPLPSSRLTARMVMSWSQSIWHDRRTPVRPLASSRDFSAPVIFVGSPSMNSTRQVVHRALPPQACKTSTLASCSIASTSLLSSGTSKVPYPSTVSLDIPTLYGMTDKRSEGRRAVQRGRG